MPDLWHLQQAPGHRSLIVEPVAPLIQIAVDLIGGTPEVAFEAASIALAARADLSLILVGPDLGPLERATYVEATETIAPVGDAMVSVRAARRSGIRVAHRLVRDGDAQGCVSAAPPEIVEAAALFSLGQIPGITRPIRALVEEHSVVVDAGHAPDLDLIAQCLLQGSLLAGIRGAKAPVRAGVLVNTDLDDAVLASILEQDDYLGQLSAEQFLFNASIDLKVGDLDVVRMIRSAASGALKTLMRRLDDRMDSASTALIAEASANMELSDHQMSSESFAPLRKSQGCAFVLGVSGVSVAAPDATESFASAILLAASAAQDDLVGKIAHRMQGLVDRRRGALA